MVLTLLAALVLQTKSETPTAHWMTNLKDAQAKAKDLGRPLVIDASREA